ncbi:hypothetical protein [Aureimonas glaciei]|uniref:Uncharacterized protein n=1 Tax=Aureimonas glaciei TaxID=1776957 RepID=A0A916Y0H3_9HYPH|nr:hypothetical protein [Aureimonas glaciei]GGD24228.1 hypothetical protein GCM10011335_28950 [Aureimonas glaciei]
MNLATNLTKDGKRIQVRFTYDAALVSAVKRIPGAKWDSAYRCWSIAKRYEKQLASLADMQASAETCYVDLAKSYSEKLRLTATHASVSIDVRERTATVRPVNGVYLGAVGTMRGSRSFKENERFGGYTVPLGDASRFDVLVEQLGEVVASHKRKLEAAKAAEQERARARVEAAEQDRATGRSRFGTLLSRAPAVGAIMRRGENIVRITGHGRSFRLDDESSSMGWPSGCEGELACYAYYENAIAEEIETFEAAEEKARVAKEIVSRRRAAIARIEKSDDRPDIGAEPEGEVLWRDDSHALGGFRRWIVLTPDGWLWSVTYMGGDGDTWIQKNCGYCTSGSRLPSTPELVSALRGDTVQKEST